VSKREQGFTLIEGMIAAAVLAVGLLALAGMQGLSIGRNVDGNELGRVTSIASDMMERVKFNKQNALAYHNLTTTTASAWCAGMPAAQLMARGDCTQWKALVDASGLANAVGTVSVVRLDADPTLNPVTLNQLSVTVSLSWSGNNHAQSSGIRTKTVMFSTVLAPES